ncbi:MAG: ferrous iron transport protein A [Tissierellales bacterium]|nr:ferrous iron transport protein A [Tissierellales bacterium]
MIIIIKSIGGFNLVLAEVKQNNKCKIKNITKGQMATKRLYELGLNTGAEVKVEKNDFGPIILRVYGNKLALGRSLAEQIEVEEVNN